VIVERGEYVFEFESWQNEFCSATAATTAIDWCPTFVRIATASTPNDITWQCCCCCSFNDAVAVFRTTGTFDIIPGIFVIFCANRSTATTTAAASPFHNGVAHFGIGPILGQLLCHEYKFGRFGSGGGGSIAIGRERVFGQRHGRLDCEHHHKQWHVFYCWYKFGKSARDRSCLSTHTATTAPCHSTGSFWYHQRYRDFASTAAIVACVFSSTTTIRRATSHATTSSSTAYSATNGSGLAAATSSSQHCHQYHNLVTGKIYSAHIERTALVTHVGNRYQHAVSTAFFTLESIPSAPQGW
jgi:hypothetical protein